jgi:hypothetical protein
MDWDDDELEQLVLKAAELCGEGALHDLSGYSYVVEGPALRSALKAELRRLVRSH